MKIITTTSVFPANYPPEKVVRELACLGFDGVDIGIDTLDSPFLKDNYIETAKLVKRTADECGIELTHSHLPGDVSMSIDIHSRLLEAFSVMGIKYTVVHPVWRCADGHIIKTVEEYYSVNLPLFKEILGYAEKYGITLLNENLLWGPSIFPDIISDFVDAVNSESFSWCFDTGHANIFGITAAKLKDIKNKPISLHIQDNHGGGKEDLKYQVPSPYTDEHLIPGDGLIDWKQFLIDLKACGYKGEFVLEAHHQPLEAAEEERADILAELLRRAREMVAYYNTL